MSGANAMRASVESYLAYRRKAGYAMKVEGRQLFRFADFADAAGHKGPLTRELTIAWATSATGTRKPSQLTSARRIEVLRAFARYHKQFEPETDIPPVRLFGDGHRRKTPHIYSDKEISDLLKGCSSLHPSGGLRGHSCAAVFGLLSATGMRVSEATGLDVEDVDLKTGVVEIQGAKFGKSRWVPLHPTAIDGLRQYAEKRDAVVTDKCSKRFFRDDYGRALSTRAVSYAFTLLRTRLKWKSRGDYDLPRLHDLRHTFICRKVQQWYEQGVDVDKQLLSLSTYVGHVKVSDTYWYLTATPTLMACAAERFLPISVEEIKR